ncbi:MAG: hypothetical protein JWM93_2617 [Frankiales bacterium]|nr:hypothetical protein [Frankiales bacterium]
MTRRPTIGWSLALSAVAVAACSPAAAPRVTEPPPAAATPHAHQSTAAGSGATGPSATGQVATETVRVSGNSITVAPGNGGTSVIGVGNVRRSIELPGRWVLPHVVVDGPPEGVTPTASKLALAAAGPADAESSRFVVVDLARDTATAMIEVPGQFTFDAWSPDGVLMYLIEHRPPFGSGKYVVRAYDTQNGSLRPDAIADKRTLGEEMAGLPIARASTPDGARVATLYVPHPSGAEGAGHEGLGHPHGPFVHLLFADVAQALCVDLPADVGAGWALTVVGPSLRIGRAGAATAYEIDLQSGDLATVSA